MNKKFKYLILFFSLSFTLLTGCASIIHGTKENETFNTVPNGANITIDGQIQGKSPVTVALKRNQSHIVAVNLPGYEPAQLKLEKTASGWILGNIIFGGIIGVVIDVADGAIYKLSPAELAAVSSNTKIQHVSDESVTIILAKEIPSAVKKQKITQLKKST